MLRRGFSHTNLQYKYGVHLIFTISIAKVVVLGECCNRNNQVFSRG